MFQKISTLLLLFLSFTSAVNGQDRIVIRTHLDSTFDQASTQKLHEALEILEVALNSEAFKKRVLEENFNVGNNHLTSEEIYQLLVGGEDNYIDAEKDGELNFRLSLFDEPFKKKNNDNFGVTNMATRITRTHRCFVLNNDVRCYASHLMHEYMHQIGFIDKRRFLGLGTKTSSVPYKIGRIVDELIGNPTSCLAQQGTCSN